MPEPGQGNDIFENIREDVKDMAKEGLGHPGSKPVADRRRGRRRRGADPAGHHLADRPDRRGRLHALAPEQEVTFDALSVLRA